MENNCSYIYDRYHNHLESLKFVVKETEKRILSGDDNLFCDNINFFSRSYLINLCTYLESYLTEIATKVFERHCSLINSYKVPRLFISASLSSWEIKKDKSSKIEIYNIFPTKKEIKTFFDANKISGNIKKTFNVFEILGVDLNEAILEQSLKDQISAIVNKRNDIVHRNEQEIDISLGDILNYINIIDNYMGLVKNCVIKSVNSFI